MSEPGDWSAWFSSLDEVRPTPPAVRERIRQRVWESTTDQAPGEADGFEVDLAVAPLPSPGRETPSPRWRWPAAGLVAAAVVLVCWGVWGGWLDQRSDPQVVASQFRSRSSELACRDLRRASEELTLLAEDGPLPVTAAQLATLHPALDTFVDELAAVGFSDASLLEQWERVVTELRQAAVFASGDETEAAEQLLGEARRQTFTLVSTSDHPWVVACFDPLVG